MNSSVDKRTNILSAVIIILAVASSAGGLFLPGLYNDNDFVRKAWFTNDIITLFIAVPILLLAMVKSQGGSTFWKLIWMGMLGYMFYNYAFYLFGAAFNEFFLMYTGLFSLSVFLLLQMLWSTNAETVPEFFNKQTPVKWISVYLFLMPLILLMVEISMILSFLLSGQIPETIIITGHPTGVVFALDLSFVVPLFVAAGFLLWKRKGWGYILALMMLVKGFTYGLVLCLSTALLALTGTYGKWDPLMPLYLVLTIGGITGCFLLYRHYNEL